MKTELTVTLTPALAAELRKACREEGVPTQELVKFAIAEKLDRVRAVRWLRERMQAGAYRRRA